jgi:two-component system LytT family response regulator
MPDLLFLDINMPDINGIELLKSLPVKPMVIFTTAYKQFAHQGFDLDAIDYLVKPIDFERFTRAVNKARSAFRIPDRDAGGEDDSLFVRSEYKLLKIELGQIDYIENLGDYLKIYLSGQKPVMTLMTLKSIATKLPAEKFLRIHRSYIVPLRKIVSIVNQKVLLGNQTELPVGESYSENLNKWIKK